MQFADWAVMLLYGAFVVGLGLRVGRGAKSGEGHLRGDRSLPAWAVVFSVLATEVSAATYIGVPAAAFNGDWTYLEFAVGALLGKLALSTWFIRLYWRLNLPTVYGFLRARVGPRTHVAATWAFLFGRLIASGVRVYIAARAFSVVTGFDLSTAIVVMTAISTLYTLFGGLKAVVWTDVAQGSLFFLGAATAVAIALLKIDQPIGAIVSDAVAQGKLTAVAFAPEEGLPWFQSVRPLPVAALAGFFLALASHGCDQENVQHLLNVRSERGSASSIAWSGLFTFPVVAMFLSVGTALWAFYRAHPSTVHDFSDPEVAKNVFPRFVLEQAPTGVRGLVFAGLFAAAISSLAATLNATTTAWTSDVRPRPKDDGPASLRRARRLMIVFGALLLGVAVFFARWDEGSSRDLVLLALHVSAIVYGGLLGAFLSALVFKRRGSDVGTATGLALGVALGVFFFFHKELFDLNKPWLAFPLVLPLQAAVAFGFAAITRKNPLDTAASAARDGAKA
jgi:solute:Na+ symporter, SSS family